MLENGLELCSHNRCMALSGPAAALLLLDKGRTREPLKGAGKGRVQMAGL